MRLFIALTVAASLLFAGSPQAFAAPVLTKLLGKSESSSTPEHGPGRLRVPNSELLQDLMAPQAQPAARTAAPSAAVTPPNLIPNPDLETAGSGDAPASWRKGGYGTNTRTLTYPAPGSSGNGIRVQLSNYTNGDAKWFFEHVPVSGGTTYQFSDQYQASTQSIVTAEFKMQDGTYAYKDFLTLPANSSFSTASGQFTAPTGAVSATIFHLIKSNGTLTTDTYSLTEVNSSGGDNYVANSGFETGSAVPDSWTKGRWGTSTTTFSYPVTGSNGDRAAQITINGWTSGDAKWAFTPLSLPSGNYTYTDEYTATIPTYLTLELKRADGTFAYQDLLVAPATASWATTSANFSVPAGTQSVRVFHLINRNGTLTLDNVSVTDRTGGGTSVFDTGAVTLRFDDAWDSQYQNAVPKLKSAGLKGTFYVVSRQIEDTGYPGYMTKAQIQEVATDGNEIGAHTQTHVDLATLPYSQQYAQIKGSRDDLQLWNVGPINSFSYPFGSYNADSLQAVKDAGFESAASSNGGYVTLASDPYQLERYGLESSTTWTEIKNRVDTALANKRWLILTAHQVQSSCSDQYCITPTLFNQLVDYLKANNVRVVTVSEGLDSL